MGACYSVRLKVKVQDEPGAIKALNDHMTNNTRADYSLEEYAEQGITTETFDDLMRIFLAGWKGQEVFINPEKRFTIYENDFDASYGWEVVLMDMFEVLTPFVKNGSELFMYVDNDYDRLVVKRGKCVQVH